MLHISRRILLRTVVAPGCVAAALLLAGCDGAAPTQPLELTVTATDAAAPVDVGQPTTMSFTVTNPGNERVDKVYVFNAGDGLSTLQAVAITCSAHATTCPVIAGTNVAQFALPAGASLTFVVDVGLVVPAKGAASLTFTVASTARMGFAAATGHATAVDGREGGYEIFAASGLRTNVDVQFMPGAPSFSVSSGSVDKGMAFHNGLYTFPSGGHLASAPDLLVGQADFGSGLDTFVAARHLVMALSDLDGTSFSTFNVVRGTANPGTATAIADIGPLAIDQATIAGSTLTLCAFSVGAIATCDPPFLQHFALAQPDGPVITATGTDNAIVFTFQVARSGTSLILLRADKDEVGNSAFTVGFANARAPATEHTSTGTTGAAYGGPGAGPGGTAGVFGLLDLTPTTLQFMPLTATGLFDFPAYTLAFTGTDDGLPGLVHGTRPTDGVEVFVLQQGALTLVGTLTGEFGIAADR